MQRGSNAVSLAVEAALGGGGVLHGDRRQLLGIPIGASGRTGATATDADANHR